MTATEQQKTASNIAGIVVGILIAALILIAGYWLIHANDGLDCATSNAQRAQSGEPLQYCD